MTAVFTGIEPMPDQMAPVTVNSGDTVNFPAASGNVCLCIEAAATLALLTVNLPPIPVGYIARIFTTVDVTSLILSPPVLNTVVALAKNDCVSLYKLAADTFVRLSA